ncbi:magnesium chelatase subunit D family protein [uncultured Bilophila sp.]|uniref:magnesium chelatase subunit D family protein n=1 Tax=uncultured Bilophila sp. TaxID=529385 RepID=UPI00280ADB78|nr:magnesium chelatase subunit D family protein [uncultured Bilophila sp.]
MSGKWRVFPFTALVGQEKIKRALLANAVLPSIGGVLLRGEKGTAKSTAVRGLASLLPGTQAVAGCLWHCDPRAPEGSLCPACAEKKRRGALPAMAFTPQLVDVPLSASEDRVAGSLDMEVAFREGKRILQPGLLAAAHRGILYIDEVNLLPDHVADIIVEACSEGVNRIRREGISAEHPSCFVLVGTMNPEEGELRPQLLDRFGLAVSVSAPNDVEKRLSVLRLRERFDADPQGFLLRYAEQEAALAVRIREAQRLVSQVRIPRLLMKKMAEIAAEALCAGHRGELALERTARAFAALAARQEVREEDVLEAEELALAHRRRMAAPPPQERQEQERSEHSSSQGQEHSRREEDRDEPQEHSHSQGNPLPDAASQLPPQGNAQGVAGVGDVDQVFAIGAPFTIRPIRLRKDRMQRKGTGRRSRTSTPQKVGRTVGSLPLVGHEMKHADIAWDATLRASALHHSAAGGGWSRPVITRDDIRTKRREKKIGNLIVFSVDASGSMGAARRMEEAKGAVLSLLVDAYQKRDKVAFVAFRGQQAEVLLHPTGSVEQAYRKLEELPTGGRTPLASGLEESHRIIKNQLRKDPDTRPILLVLSDGRANVAPNGVKPMPAALEAARRIAADGRIHSLVIDVERQGLVQFAMAKTLSEALEADYMHLEELKADTLVRTLKDIL